MLPSNIVMMVRIDRMFCKITCFIIMANHFSVRTVENSAFRIVFNCVCCNLQLMLENWRNQNFSILEGILS